MGSYVITDNITPYSNSVIRNDVVCLTPYIKPNTTRHIAVAYCFPINLSKIDVEGIDGDADVGVQTRTNFSVTNA
jgi:hypothetical protein